MTEWTDPAAYLGAVVRYAIANPRGRDRHVVARPAIVQHVYADGAARLYDLTAHGPIVRDRIPFSPTEQDGHWFPPPPRA